MKNRYLLLAIICSALFLSCSSTYTYYQVMETTPDSKTTRITSVNNTQKYEGSDCDLYYYFWGNGGNSDCMVYNKTDKLLFIDLSKSFFIMNGTAYDLFLNKTFTNTSTITEYSYSSTSYGNINSKSFFNGAAHAATVSEVCAVHGSTTAEKKILAIPPHSYKMIDSYSISTARYESCDLPSYPPTKATSTFNEDNTPLHFSYYLTYTMDCDTAPRTILNGFYVSSISNYPTPEIIDFVERPIPCENLKVPDVKYMEGVYDAQVKANVCNPASSFYHTNKVDSSKKLFKDNRGTFHYQRELDGYTKSLDPGRPNSTSSKPAIIVLSTVIVAFAAAAVVLSNL